MVTMGDAGYPQSNPANCTTFGTTANNFQDPGGTANYPANYNDTITFCPDLNLGTKMSITMAINAGYTWNVDGSDFVYVYDGPNASSPLLGVYNSVTAPTGFTHQASWNNPSGCLTIVFISNGSAEGTGWLANVQCGNQFQPFQPHIEAYINGLGANALNPIDTGYGDICFGDSILLIAKPIFSYSEETTGFGYSQDVNSTIVFDWNISDGNLYPNNDSIWFTPQTRSGFLVDLKLTDIFPQSERMLCKVRVSQLPSFAGTGPLEDTVCLGQNTNLIGGVTATDTVGISIPEGTFELGGAYAGLTYLPDGSGMQYQAPITISGFPSDAVINDAQSLNQVCITMEHSYLGDLEIWLQCPSGQIVPLVNSYSPGNIPGGNSGGGTFLGQPFDDAGGGGAGIGWEYCFSSVFNDIGPMTQNLGNTVPVAFVAGTPNLSAGNSMNSANTYAPEISYATFAGCPVNGNWTIFVQDNLGIDDGYIFEWGLFFDGSYFPGLSGYQNTVVSEYWESDPSIISGQNDTLLVIQPNTPGNYNYVYHITDDFGCEYDTTVTLFVQPLPTIFGDTVACDMVLQVSGTTAYNGGVWSTTSPELTVSPSLTTMNPLITASAPGMYTVSFTDNACNQTVSSQVLVPPYPMIFDDTLLCDLTFQVAGTQAYSTGGVWSASSPLVSFGPSNTALNPLITSASSGNYIITFTDNICQNTVSSNLTQIIPPSIFEEGVGCYYQYQVANTVSFDGGVWNTSDTVINFSNWSADNPIIYTEVPGSYTVSYTDNQCDVTVTAEVYFPPLAYTQVLDTIICQGSSYTIYAQQNVTVTNFVWNTGATGPSITVDTPGDYIVSASNICHTHVDTATIGVKVCDIDAPNIIVLSSLAGNNAFFIQYEGVSQFECSILNRWGNTIYNYSDPSGKWDGRTNGGDLVAEGTYFYIIKATFEGGEEVTKQGFVQVKY
jgi:subtilisin-like proprotein convertase family protein